MKRRPFAASTAAKHGSQPRGDIGRDYRCGRAVRDTAGLDHDHFGADDGDHVGGPNAATVGYTALARALLAYPVVTHTH